MPDYVIIVPINIQTYLTCTWASKGDDIANLPTYLHIYLPYTQACLGDDRVCPNCAPETRKVAEMMRMRESKDNSEKQEQFFKQLEGAKDGFAVVAEYYGKGIFDTNNPKNARRRSKASI
ncbi:hypothetical protein SARC_13886 [Sphaeroforma arctica JP610]|uniref:Vacuolar protein sorting protein 11 C-terminal domain-containing protein n=1 Tax=Sphaeroforma arctica JP610 TaxID=667725 RepID=A0A0L0FA10_9EUKA|nr:hypothetical protein SARC_13886 [Sphaeroforma arctica JP610]KNC73555.1 hypothetical protein SARC_13886 [Sphaeroforma arctica JP610]|eukprot:XP_014147457.1 hypothetical protein SARC_13886 [Sphaeroforma arctica JP610]